MNKKIYLALGAIVLVLAGALLMFRKNPIARGTDSAEQPGQSETQRASAPKSSSLIWWGAYDLEINSGGVITLLNPYKNFYRKGDYVIVTMNDKGGTNNSTMEMIASVSPGLKAIITQELSLPTSFADPRNTLFFNQKNPATPEKLKALNKVMSPGSDYDDENLSITSIPLDMGECVLLVKDKNSGLRFVYAAAAGSPPAQGIAKALELAKDPVDYLFADLTRVPQDELRSILYEFHPRHLMPLAYPYEIADIINEQAPAITTDLPVIYGSQAGETIGSIPIRRYELPGKLQDINTRYLPRFLGPIKRFLSENPRVGTLLLAPKPGEEINLLAPPLLENLPKEDEQPTKVPTKQQPDYLKHSQGEGQQRF